MNRRKFLGGIVGTGSVALAGCMNSAPRAGSAATPTPTTHLSAPDRNFESEELPYPGYGMSLPEATLHDPVAGVDVTTTDFDDRNVLLTFLYTTCDTVCSLLGFRLSAVQAQAREGGYSDEVMFLVATFDPVRDTAARLREWGENMGVDYEAENWHFLRPSSEARAKEVIDDKYGAAFEKTGAVESDEYMYKHVGLLFLANEAELIERVYFGKYVEATEITTDLERLLEAQA